jgi:HD-GYP domain-containing protein (c-di-GMP phosphodiesterase class II)
MKIEVLTMKVHAKDLEVGCIVNQDIMGRTSLPILTRNTVIQKQHIKALWAFGISEVSVEKTKADGSLFRPANLISPNKEKEQTETTSEQTGGSDQFIRTYLNSVQSFKRQFQQWQSGMSVDIAEMREVILPLTKMVAEESHLLYYINEYSSKTEYMYHHSIAVGIISAMLGKKLGLDAGNVNQIALAGVLADCGMSRISPLVLKKQTALTENEFKEIKMHTAHSYKMIKEASLLKPEAKLAIFQHHERIDGSGYPTKEKNERVHLYSQIVAISDVFHAMTSERLYRSKQPIFKVLEMIRRDLFGKFNFKVVNALLDLFGNLTTGTQIRLSSGQMAEVVFTKSNYQTRPIVRVVPSEEIIDLSTQTELYISAIM